MFLTHEARYLWGGGGGGGGGGVRGFAFSM